MADPKTFTGRTESWIVVQDKDGEEYVCPKSVLKKAKEMTPEELKDCVPDYRSGGGSVVGG
jgi:hypothetical protein